MQNEKQLIEIINSVLFHETEEMSEIASGYEEDPGSFYYGNESDALELGRTLESYDTICMVKDRIMEMRLTHLFPETKFTIEED